MQQFRVSTVPVLGRYGDRAQAFARTDLTNFAGPIALELRANSRRFCIIRQRPKIERKRANELSAPSLALPVLSLSRLPEDASGHVSKFFI